MSMPLHGKRGNQQPMNMGSAKEKQVGKGCCLMGHWAKFGLIWAFVWWIEKQGNGPQIGPKFWAYWMGCNGPSFKEMGLG